MLKAPTFTHKTQSRRGFTLLELIAVMGIAVALSLVIIGGYSGIMRTMSEMAGVNALRRAATLARQHATIDGRDTYFFITGFDTYVLCRRAGVISDRHERSLSGDDRPTYLPPGQYADTIWLYDQYSDLGAAAESFAGIGSTGELTADQVEEMLEDDKYSGTFLFDLEKGEFAAVTYPPWFDHKTDCWVMGISKKDADGKAIKEFKEGHAYGWTLYPEQRLPKGYAFVNGKDNFIEAGSFYFKPDGMPDSRDTPPRLEVSVQELSSGTIATIKIEKSGKIEADY